MVGCASGASATEFVVDASTAGLLRTTADDQLCFDEGGGRGGSERTVCAADGLECPVDGSDICYSKETVDWWETCESLGGAELTPDECAGASDVLGWPKHLAEGGPWDVLPRGCVVNLKKTATTNWPDPKNGKNGYQSVYLNYDNPDQTKYVGTQRFTHPRSLLCKRTTGQKCYTSHEKPSFYLNRTVEGGWIPDGPRKHCRWKMEGSAIVAKDITSASGASLCLTANGDKTTASPDQYFSWRPHPAHPRPRPDAAPPAPVRAPTVRAARGAGLDARRTRCRCLNFPALHLGEILDQPLVALVLGVKEPFGIGQSLDWRFGRPELAFPVHVFDPRHRGIVALAVIDAAQHARVAAVALAVARCQHAEELADALVRAQDRASASARHERPLLANCYDLVRQALQLHTHPPMSASRRPARPTEAWSPPCRLQPSRQGRPQPKGGLQTR